MRCSLFFVIVALLAVVALSHELDRTPLLKHAMKDVSSMWRVGDRADPNELMELHIAVKQQNVDVLEDIFWSRSDPKSSHYAQWLDFDRVNTLTAPTSEAVQNVLGWLRSANVDLSENNLISTPNSDLLSVMMTVAEAERLLHTQYFNFHHSITGHRLVRTAHYSLPSYVHSHIDFVGPTIHLFNPLAFANNHKGVKLNEPRKSLKQKLQKKHSVGAPNDQCTAGISPACLRQLYNINSYTATSPKSSMTCTGYLEQYISLSDLATFFTQYVPSMVKDVPAIVGPNDQTQPGTEASLDIQYIMGVGQGVNASFWYTAGRQPNNTQNEPFLVFLQNLASTADAPWVVSTSYGDDEPSVDYDYAVRVNNEFMKAGVRGISLLFSSGDGGVAGGQGTSCGPQGQFVATYPAASPYVTAVGGTTGWPESAATFSSGGFSNYWPSPSYQTSAVSDYIHKYGQQIPPQNLWNATGRGFPDVSAQSEGFPVVQGGFTMPVDGTSCASPAFSGVVGLLNDVRFNLGKTSLGFLNPLFYQNPSAFFDCTQGSNPGCNTNGFQANQGWDPATGLGSPNFTALSKVVSQLQ